MGPSQAKPLNKSHLATLSGIITFVLGITLLILKPHLLDLVLRSVLVLKPNSPIVDLWLKMPVQIPTDVYFFNWTNPDDIHNFSIKPRFEQIGPYRFMQNMEKTNVIWNANNTVTYNQMRTWNFNQQHSNRNLTDKITILNNIALCLAHYVRNWSYIFKQAVNMFLVTSYPDISMTRSVNELLIEGYDDPVIDISNYLPFIAPEIPRFDKFGWLLVRNGSSDFDGVFNKATGFDGDFEIHNWNYYNVTPYFNSSCARMHGSEGELFSYPASKTYIDVFSSDICRHVRLDFEKEVVVNGILGYKYTVGSSALDNGTLIPGNECFCVGGCVPSGMLSISSCRYGLPGYVSLPHFYGADPVYLDAVEGLRPDKSKHEAFIVLEPKTGIPLQAVGRIQLNLFVHPINGIQTHKDVPELFYPLMWGEQTYTIQGSVELLLNVFLCLPYVLNTISIVLAIVGFYLIICVSYKSVVIYLFKRKLTHKCEYTTVEPERLPLQQ